VPGPRAPAAVGSPPNAGFDGPSLQRRSSRPRPPGRSDRSFPRPGSGNCWGLFQVRSARFRCVIAIAVKNEGLLASADGVCEGMIAEEPSGDGGFGYDPVFYLPDWGKTMAQLPSSEKHRISHRGRALQAIKPALRKILNEGIGKQLLVDKREKGKNFYRVNPDWQNGSLLDDSQTAEQSKPDQKKEISGDQHQ